ncbi:MAG: hypothetical protein Q7K25_04950 [Actinomycetota bacterium]|nr:hypothetical protein [Actinomycetota bacterium]
MADDQFDALLARIPEIAKAVNAFTSPEIQQAAFELLVATMSDEDAPVKPPKDPSKTITKSAKKTVRKTSAASDTPADVSKPKRQISASPPKIDKDLDLVPKGKRSFKEFVASTQPANNNERVLVAAYWLTHEIDEDATTRDRIFTCFRDSAWPIPTDLSNTISQTGSKNLLSSTRTEIRVSVNGINFVEHTMLKRPPLA